METSTTTQGLDYAIVASNIRECLEKYIVKHNIKSLIIGESGGIDSALCTVLAKPVCDKLNIPLIGRSISIVTNKEDELERARNIGKNFCTDFNEIDLSALFNITKGFLEEEVPAPEYVFFSEKSTLEQINENEFTDYKVHMGNVKARLRMIYLYNLAGKHKGMVLSTDNYTELLAGFWTLHGDVGDYGMIQNLWKTEVYELSQYLVDHELQTTEEKEALSACVAANPTDGLGVSNSDLDQLGVQSYKEADNILSGHLSDFKKHQDHPLIHRYHKTHFKRNNPFNVPRETVLEKS